MNGKTGGGLTPKRGLGELDDGMAGTTSCFGEHRNELQMLLEGWRKYCRGRAGSV